MFIHWFYPLLLYIYYQNTQQKTEQRKHGKQGGGEDNNTVWHHATQSNEITHTTRPQSTCTSPRHNVIKPKGQNSGKETASQANKCRHNKIHMNMNAFMPKPRNPPPRNPEPPPPRKPRNPPMYETARPVYKKDINTSFTLGSRSEKMRADEGSEGTNNKYTYTNRNYDLVPGSIAGFAKPINR